MFLYKGGWERKGFLTLTSMTVGWILSPLNLPKQCSMWYNVCHDASINGYFYDLNPWSIGHTKITISLLKDFAPNNEFVK